MKTRNTFTGRPYTKDYMDVRESVRNMSSHVLVYLLSQYSKVENIVGMDRVEMEKLLTYKLYRAMWPGRGVTIPCLTYYGDM